MSGKRAGEEERRPRVVIYTRPGCHLCEEAKREMLKAGLEDEYLLEEVNIDLDPELKKLYGTEIPVITISGIRAFKYRLTAEEFKTSLRRHARR